MPRSGAARHHAISFTALALSLAGCADYRIGSLEQPLSWPAPAYCTVNVLGVGTKQVETDYLPHVITCENGAAEPEALKAQAVAARSYLYYKLSKAGSVVDGTKDQVYTCASQPQQKHFDAVKATSGQVLVWSNVVICSFFVAGGKPTTGNGCVFQTGDSDPTSTEHYVTYNEGKSGSAITQTTLGWVNPANKENRGCFSQNGSRCLFQLGRSYQQMLRFYYGADIQIETASGSCVNPQPDPDQGTPPPPDLGPPRLDSSGRLELRVADRSQPAADLRPPGVDGWQPPVDLWSEDPELVYPRLRGGCSQVPGGTEAAGPGLLLILWLLRRRRQRDPDQSP